MNLQDVIKWFQTNEIDGETMENIIREVGMEDQMLRQLIMTMPIDQIEYLVAERKELDGQNKCFIFTSQLKKNKGDEKRIRIIQGNES